MARIVIAIAMAHDTNTPAICALFLISPVGNLITKNVSDHYVNNPQLIEIPIANRNLA